MATITINVPDGTVTRIVDAMAVVHNYARDKKPGETKAQFAERVQKNIWKRQVLDVEARVAGATAEGTVRTNPADPLVTDVD